MLSLCMCVAFPLYAQQDAEPSKLADSQRRLADRYDRLELLAGRLAELTRSTQPRRARLLRELISKSREQDIAGRFEVVIGDLHHEKLGSALGGQQGLQKELQELLELLLQEDRDRQIESQRKRIGKYLEEIKQIMRLQRGVKARTEGGDQADKTARDQSKAAQAVGNLQDRIQSNEELGKAERQQAGPLSGGNKKPEPTDKNSSEERSKGQGPPSQDKQGAPGQSDKPNGKQQQPEQQNQGGASENPGQDGNSPPSSDGNENAQAEMQQTPMQRVVERLQKSQQRMQQAQEKLEKAKREQALEKQEQALRELAEAKAELERILRQLREEEKERMLVLLEARFRKMLDEQVAVYEQTKSLAASEVDVPAHELEIASGRLRRQEESIVRDADRALVLLHEDGTSVAFPIAMEQSREDMVTVAQRLGNVKLGLLTQGLEEDIIEALEETLAALKQALKELRDSSSQGKQSPGQQDEKSLVDQLAELRMIRALQNRVNRRTSRYGKLLGERQAMEVELREALNALARRQAHIFNATRDLESGRNQ